MKNCFTGSLAEYAPKSVNKPYQKCLDCKEGYGNYILDDHLRVTETSTIYEYNCDVEPYKSTGLCADIISGRNGGMCKKSDCDAFNSRGKRDNIVQMMRGAKAEWGNPDYNEGMLTHIHVRYIYLRLECEWDQDKKEPRYKYSVTDANGAPTKRR